MTMTKHQQILKALTRRTVMCACVVAAFTGVYFLTDTMATGTIPKKDAADKALKKDEGEITRLKTQLEKAATAESRYAEIMKEREGTDFSASSDAMKEWLRKAKGKYRLSNDFKLNLTPPKPVTNKELADVNYEVTEHPGMKLEFDAMSDAHVFAFIEDMLSTAPGLIRIDSLTLKRMGDLSSQVVGQLRSGATPYQVDAQIEFDWVGVTEKEIKDANLPATATPEKKK